MFTSIYSEKMLFFALSKTPEPASLKAGLSRVLQLEEGKLTLLEDWDEALRVEAQVHAVYWIVPGDFPCLIEVGGQAADEASAAAKLAIHFDCDVLISDASLNPYLWQVCVPHHPPMRCAVDPDHLDQFRAFVRVR